MISTDSKGLGKALGVNSTERKVVVLLLLYSFFVGTTNAMFFTSSSAFLVATFPSSIFPYAYLAMGGIGLPVSLFFQQLLKKTSVRNTILISNILLIFSIVLLGFVVHGNAPKWLIFANYVWYRVVAFITVIGFWTMANRAFTLQQGKRLFGLITSGEVVSSMIGFFSIPLLLKILQTQDLLFIAAVSMVFCVLLTFKIEKLDKGTTQREKSNTSSKEIIKTTYFKYMFMLAFIPIIVMYLTDFMFLDLSKAKFHDVNVLAGFFGIFFGFTAVVELITKAVLSGRMMNRYGLMVSLSISAVIFIVVLSIAALAGIISGVGSLFFSLIALAKLLERVLRSGINDPTYQILYQPLAKSVRPTAQAIIEGYSKTLAVICSALIIILFTHIPNFSILHLTIFFILIVIAWLLLSRRTFIQYTLKIKENLFSISKKEEKVVVPYPYTSTKQNEDLLFHLGALSINTEPYGLASALLSFSISSQQAKFYKGAQSTRLLVPLKIFSLENKKEYKAVIQEALSLDKTGKGKIHTVSEKDEQKQSIALLIESFEYGAYNTLSELLKSENEGIMLESILAAGKLQRLPLLPLVLQAVNSSSLTNFSLHALKEFGNAGITPLLNNLLTNQGSGYILNHIHIALSGKQDFTKEQSELMVKLFFHSTYYGKEILIKYISQGNLFITKSARDSFHEVFELECRNLFFLMSAKNEIKEFAATHQELAFALAFDIHSRMHFILALLGVIYDTKTVSVLANIIESNTSTSKMYIVEMMNFIFTKNDIGFFMPLVDNYCFGQKISTNNEPYFYTEKTAYEAMKSLLYARGKTISSYTRVEALAAFDRNSDAYKEVLLNCYIHPENAVAEWATDQLIQQFPGLLQKKQAYLNNEVQAHIEHYLKRRNTDKYLVLQIDAFRKIAVAFKSLHLPVLAFDELIETSERAKYAAGSTHTVQSNRAYGFLLSGHLTCNGYLDIASNGFFMSTIKDFDPSIVFNFTSSTKLIIFNTSVFDALVSNRPEMTGAIISFYKNIQTP